MKRINAVSCGQIAALICMLLIIFLPTSATEGAKRGLWMCGEIIVPSTFAFMAIATFIVKISKGVKRKSGLIKKLSSKIFHLPSQFLSAFCIGMLAGYPVGAKCVTELKKDGRLTQRQAQRCLAFCVGAGPAFIITAVGKGILGSFSAGIIIFLSQLLSCTAFGVISGFFTKNEDISEENSLDIAATNIDIAECFVLSVKDSCTACLNVCAFVILFSTLLNIAVSCGLIDMISSLLTVLGLNRDTAFVLAGGFLEVTSGCAMCGELSVGMLSAVSAVIGFGGLSVLFQISAIISGSGLKISKFFLSRIVIAILSAIFTATIASFFPIAVETVSLQSISAGYTLHSLPICAVLIVFAAALIISDKRKGEIHINA